MRRRIEWTLIVCALALTTCLCLLILDARNLVKAQFGVAQREGAQYRQLADHHAKQIEQDVRLRADTALSNLNDQLSRLRVDALKEIHTTTTMADSRLGEALGEIQSIHADLRPLLASATQATGSVSTLAATYSALPDRLGTTLVPSWLAIEPEITCRHADGSGYGGCWHSRISGLMGEAVRVGGVFTQQFPALVTTFQQTNTQVAGISTDVHSFTSKFVAPRSTKQKIWDGIKTAGYVGARFIPAP